MSTRPGFVVPSPAAMRHAAHPGASAKPERLYFVCTGNICRSAAGHVIARDLIAPMGFDIDSAGIGALVGHPVDADVATALHARGWTNLSHQAKQATGRWLANGSLIVVFGPEHAKWIRNERPDAAARVVPFGVLGRIAARGEKGMTPARVLQVARQLPSSDLDWVADPYRLGPQAASAAVNRIDDTLHAFADCLAR